ncbi:MAG: CDP-alcohol phosphatidyltransferase family protein [Actinobacteria bacterium]|nr:CDP-alcohol phosphatidyltransferase family protein [Actinomycetota bacterium]
MALNAYARALTDRLVVPVARGFVRLGLTADRLTTLGMLGVLSGVVVVLTGRVQAGALLMAASALADAFDGAVARLRGTSTALGSFYDSVADRVCDVAVFGLAAWLVRDDPVLFGVALVALAGALLTSYIRAKAESLGWSATVGLLERPERMTILIGSVFFGILPLGLWALAVGGLVTVAQRLRVVRRQAAAAPRAP